MTQQTNFWKIVFFIEGDKDNALLEWETTAASRKEANLQFWEAHDNPHIVILACEKKKDEAKLKSFSTWIDHYPEVDPEKIALLKKTFTERGYRERYLLPPIVKTEDETFVRAVWALAALWVQDGDDLLTNISNALLLIGQHSMRMTLTTGEYPTPKADTELYTYLRDAAMFFDFCKNGDNAVFTEKGCYDAASPYFLDLINE